MVDEHMRIGRRRKSPQETIGRHIAGQFVVVPEQPAQQLELLRFAFRAEAAILRRELQEDRRRLRQAHAVGLPDRNLAHLVDGPPPFGRAGDAAAEIGPHRLETLAAEREHQRELVAVARFREVMQPVGRHAVLPCHQSTAWIYGLQRPPQYVYSVKQNSCFYGICPADVNMTGDRERPLMEATLRIIGRNGLDGVTHRAVAAEAKMSVGALTHHFASRDILVDAALAFALSREVGRLRALALSLQGKAFDLEGWIHELVNWYAQELKTQREIHIACYEAFLAAARNPRHRTVVVEWFDTWRQSAALALRAAGSSDQ